MVVEKISRSGIYCPIIRLPTIDGADVKSMRADCKSTEAVVAQVEVSVQETEATVDVSVLESGDVSNVGDGTASKFLL